jgi:hypothetical protein
VGRSVEQQSAVIGGIDPEKLSVVPGVSHWFEAHKRDMLNERQIAANELR